MLSFNADGIMKNLSAPYTPFDIIKVDCLLLAYQSDAVEFKFPVKEIVAIGPTAEPTTVSAGKDTTVFHSMFNASHYIDLSKVNGSFNVDAAEFFDESSENEEGEITGTSTKGKVKYKVSADNIIFTNTTSNKVRIGYTLLVIGYDTGDDSLYITADSKIQRTNAVSPISSYYIDSKKEMVITNAPYAPRVRIGMVTLEEITKSKGYTMDIDINITSMIFISSPNTKGSFHINDYTPAVTNPKRIRPNHTIQIYTCNPEKGLTVTDELPVGNRFETGMELTKPDDRHSHISIISNTSETNILNFIYIFFGI